MAPDFKVEVTRILSLNSHPNADRLELAQVHGWNCVVQKGRYRVGDLVVYLPIDSVLPEELENLLFPPDSKVKLINHRIKTIKLRGAISQGLVVDAQEICDFLITPLNDGDDLTAKLKVVKYEPPAPKFQQNLGQHKKKTYKNPHFREYVDLANIKNHGYVFQASDEVVITEKIHGTNFRAGWVPFAANTLWRKFLKFIRLTPKWVFVYGSRRVQISEKSTFDGYYDENVYAEIVKKYNLMRRIPKGRIVFGEIYGAGIQKGYSYGLKEERRLVVFDLMDSETGRYLPWEQFHNDVFDLELPMVPVLYRGPFSGADVTDLIAGPSVLAPEQKVREGCVIKSESEEACLIGRKMLKAINPEYLLTEPTEYH